MTIFKRIIGISLLLTASLVGDLSAQRYAPRQRGIELIPRVVIDTIDAPNMENSSIILYTNGEWDYLHHDKEALEQHMVYQTHWDTTKIFSYRSIELAHLPEVTELQLIDDMNGFYPPVKGKVFSKYGPRRGRHHNGVDISKPVGETLYATFDGKVRYAQYNTGGYGYLVIIRHPNGLESWYAHLSRMNVKVGDYVKASQVIGYIGNTGRSRGNHLHFEFRYCDQSFDPEFLIDFENGVLRYQTFALEKSFFNILSRASEILEEDDAEYFASDSLYAQAVDSTALSKVASKLNGTKTAVRKSGAAVYHTVRSGDILGRIASRYGVSIDQVCRLNGIKRTTTLRINQRLRVK